MIIFRTSVAGPCAAPMSRPVELVSLVITPPTQTPLKVAVSEGKFTSVLVAQIETVARLVVTEQSLGDTLSTLTCSLA